MLDIDVLIVDDDEDSRVSLHEVLELALPSARVAAAADAGQAMRILMGGGVRIVVSDYKMPGEDGLSLLARARSVAPDTMRVLVTALPHVSLPAEEVQAASPSHIVVKPFDTRAFVEIIATTLGAPAPAAP